jgi:hypothetical protein
MFFSEKKGIFYRNFPFPPHHQYIILMVFLSIFLNECPGDLFLIIREIFEIFGVGRFEFLGANFEIFWVFFWHFRGFYKFLR